MGGINWVHLWGLTCLGMLVMSLCQENAAVYIVTMKKAPASHYNGQFQKLCSSALSYGASGKFNTFNKPR